MTTRSFEVRKDDLKTVRWTEEDVVPLDEGEVRCAVDLCALTANNVTYAVMGDRFGYWSYYPAEDGWGRVPAWGYAEVAESRHPEVEVGERLYGYWPMRTSVVLSPAQVTSERFRDGAPHRKGLPAAYNDYARVRNDPRHDSSKEAYHALFTPLAGTSYGLADWLERERYKGAGRVLCTSASSKTAIGTALLIKERDGAPDVVGLTSSRNLAITEKVGAYARVSTYDALDELDPSMPTVIVDMAGDGALSARLHTHLGDAMKHNCVVGAAHPEAERRAPGMKDDRTELFFMPGYAAERIQETSGRFLAEMRAASRRVADQAAGWMRIEEAATQDEITSLWARVRDGELAPDEGGILRLGTLA